MSLAAVKTRLMNTGRFRTLQCPEGVIPLQLFGQLTSGEHLYFRARGTKVSLEISSCEDGPVLARYERKVQINHVFGAGMMNPSDAATMIIDWVGSYA